MSVFLLEFAILFFWTFLYVLLCSIKLLHHFVCISMMIMTADVIRTVSFVHLQVKEPKTKFYQQCTLSMAWWKIAVSLSQTTWRHSCLEPNHVIFALPLKSFQWRHNERDGVAYHQSPDCLFNRLLKKQIKENIKSPRHWPLSVGRASNAANVSIWWRHHDLCL